MPSRGLPLITDYYYHVYNRGNNKQRIFYDPADYQRFLGLTNYYRFINLPGSYSGFLKLKEDEQKDVLNYLKTASETLVDIVCFCLMPNHYHFLLKQRKDKGITKYLSNLQNGYARYFNKKNNRIGFMFQGRFKAILVENEAQLLHLSRYIHLNPYSAGLARNKKELVSFLWSSLAEYLKKEQGLCQKDMILPDLRGATEYKKFVFDYRDYQKDIETIKHLTNE